MYLLKNKLDGKFFILKEIKKNKIKQYDIDIYREINIHYNLKHKNVITLYDYYEDINSIYLILEYAENGNLFDKIQKSNGLPESLALRYFSQVSSAIYFLHENCLIHSEIKPENCLLDKNDNLKLNDFSWKTKANKVYMKILCGTHEEKAGEKNLQKSSNQMIDVRSLGILLYEMINSFSPFRVYK